MQKALSALGFSNKILQLASGRDGGTGRTENAFQDQRAGERLDLSGVGAGAGAFIRPGDSPISFSDPRFPGIDFPTTGPVEGLDTFHPGADFNPGATGAEAGGATASGGAASGAEASGAAAGSTASGAGQAAAAIAAVLPYLQAAANIYGRSEGRMDEGTQAGLAAWEVADAALAGVSGGMSVLLGNINRMGISDDLISLTHNEREALDFGDTAAEFRDLLPRLQGATSIDEIADALQTRPGGWGSLSDNKTITLNGAPISDKDALRAALDAARGDPGSLSFQWHQGLIDDKRTRLENALNDSVRNHLAVLRAAEMGIPEAREMLTQGRGRRAKYALDRDNLYAPEMSEGTPTGGWTSPDWAPVRQLIGEMKAAGLDLGPGLFGVEQASGGHVDPLPLSFGPAARPLPRAVPDAGPGGPAGSDPFSAGTEPWREMLNR
jgi:hypothetical protein